MNTPPDNKNEVLAAIAALQGRLDQLVESDDRRAEGQREYVDALKAQVDAQGHTLKAVVDAQASTAAVINLLAEGVNDLNSRMNGLEVKVDGLDTRMDGLDTRMDGLETRMNGLEAKVDGLADDIAEVKGEHALSAVLRRAHLVADALDCELVAEVPRGVFLGFAKIAEANGESSSNVESFKNADMILHVVNRDKHPSYVAVEASFTVDCRDVARASRNAAYLNKFTGLRSYGVVAGVEVLQDAQKHIDAGTVQLYRIQRRELQPA